MKISSFIPLYLIALCFFGCNGQNQEQEESENLTESDATAVYEDHKVDSLTIRIDESTESLEREIDIVQNDIDSLLGDN